MGVFFERKWLLGDRRVGAPCLDSAKGWCIMRIVQSTMFGSFYGLWNRVRCTLSHHGRQGFLGMRDSDFLVQCGHIKKLGNAVTFSSVAPVQLHCQNRKQLCVGGNIWESNVRFLGDQQFDFFSDGEKIAERHGSKRDESKVGVNQKYVPYTYKKFTYCSTYQCTP